MDTYTSQEIRDAAKRMGFERTVESLLTNMRRLQEAAELTRSDDDTITRKRLRDAVTRLRDKGMGSLLTANDIFREDRDEWEQRKQPQPQPGEVWHSNDGNLYQRTVSGRWRKAFRDGDGKIYIREYVDRLPVTFPDEVIKRPIHKVSE